MRSKRQTALVVVALAAAATALMTVGGAAAAPPATLYKYDDAGNLVRATNTGSDPDNCGGDGIVCSYANLSRACYSGVCAGTCFAGFADCNSDKRLDGCEANLHSLVSCGSCGVVCSTSHVTRACSGSAVGDPCSPGTCATGWGDCNGNKQVDGCETDLTRTIATLRSLRPLMLEQPHHADL